MLGHEVEDPFLEGKKKQTSECEGGCREVCKLAHVICDRTQRVCGMCRQR